MQAGEVSQASLATPMVDRPVAVYGALAANAAIAATKFGAAAVTGSSAMLSEGVHSLVDTANQGLLLYGVRRGLRPADPAHPFGHGSELYYWALLVAVALFGIGGGLAFYEGVSHLQHPSPLTDPTWNYAVLAVAFAFDGGSWLLARREIHRDHPGLGLWRAFRQSKDPAIYTVLAEDTADLVGIVLAALGVAIGHATGNPMWDGLASMAIGLLLAGVSLSLARTGRSLLTGQAAAPEIVDAVRQIAEGDPAVVRAAVPLTMHLGPSEVLACVELAFRPDLAAEEVARASVRIEAAIRDAHPEVTRVFTEAAPDSGTTEEPQREAP